MLGPLAILRPCTAGLKWELVWRVTTALSRVVCSRDFCGSIFLKLGGVRCVTAHIPSFCSHVADGWTRNVQNVLTGHLDSWVQIELRDLMTMLWVFSSLHLSQYGCKPGHVQDADHTKPSIRSSVGCECSVGVFCGPLLCHPWVCCSSWCLVVFCTITPGCWCSWRCNEFLEASVVDIG